MQQRPNKSELLLAVARFLEREVKPAIKDNPALAFRVLIAANLAGTTAGEIWAEDALSDAELTRLLALVPDVDIGDAIDAARPAGRRAAIATLNRALADRIKLGALDEEALRRARSAVLWTLKEGLAVTSPRFDTGADVP